MSVFIHIVTFNSASEINKALSSINQVNCSNTIYVTDNASTDRTVILVKQGFPTVNLRINQKNYGFCGGHNLGVKDFLESDFKYLLILNPDIYIPPGMIDSLIKAAELRPEVGLFTPKILRCDDQLIPIKPPVIDAAGMELNSAIRHLDRGSGELDKEQFNKEESVFGGTGAALLIRRDAVSKLLLNVDLSREMVADINQDLLDLNGIPQLFDEAFFAYREDADLCWRANNFGIEVRYIPDIVFYHKRKVTPERRKDLPKNLNCWSVRNRFLLQINNFFITRNSAYTFIFGVLLRNLLVILGVLIREPESIQAFKDLKKLRKRAGLVRKFNRRELLA